MTASVLKNSLLLLAAAWAANAESENSYDAFQ